MLWDSTSERPAVEREVLQLVNPGAGEALDLQDAIGELEAPLDSKAGQSRESLSQWAISQARITAIARTMGNNRGQLPPRRCQHAARPEGAARAALLD